MQSRHLFVCEKILINFIPGPYLFDKEAHGPKVDILDDGRLARRYEGYCWAVCLGDRPLKINETLHFNITEIESGWGAGSLNVGISYKSPDDYHFGDLVICDQNVTEDLPETEVFIFQHFYSSENVYSFRVDGMGVAYLSPNVTSNDVIFTGVNVNKTVWMIFNLFGDARAVELLGVTKDS